MRKVTTKIVHGADALSKIYQNPAFKRQEDHFFPLLGHLNGERVVFDGSKTELLLMEQEILMKGVEDLEKLIGTKPKKSTMTMFGIFAFIFFAYGLVSAILDLIPFVKSLF